MVHKAHQEREWPDLTAVGVSRDLQGNVQGRGFIELSRLIRQEDDRVTHVTSVKRIRKSGCVIAPEAARHEVGHAGDVESGVTGTDGSPVILKDIDTQLAHEGNPCRGVGKELMVPGHGECSEPCAEVTKRSDCIRECRNRAVDEVAAQGNEVWIERVGAVDDVAHVRWRRSGRHVQVRNDRDGRPSRM